MVQLWKEGRTRFTNQLEKITESDLPKKLAPTPNTVGFLLRHIGEVELLFAKNVFHLPEVKVVAKTVIAQKDSGEWTNLQELLSWVNESAVVLEKAILGFPETDWNTSITTKEFGTKTMAEALGRITTHTAYHAGQMALILKYGS